jgi:hypothetical protein
MLKTSKDDILGGGMKKVQRCRIKSGMTMRAKKHRNKRPV